jgi:hypothetical protein
MAYIMDNTIRMSEIQKKISFCILFRTLMSIKLCYNLVNTEKNGMQDFVHEVCSNICKFLFYIIKVCDFHQLLRFKVTFNYVTELLSLQDVNIKENCEGCCS